MLAKLGCRYVLAGHSERREIHGEDDATVNRKVHAAVKHGIVPILCVGEGLAVREEGRHVEHTTAQLLAGLAQGVEPARADAGGRLRAGVGDRHRAGGERGATPRRCAPRSGRPWPGSTARRSPPGSACSTAARSKPGNVGEIVGQPDVDGALVGGASLDADGFAQLCAIAAGGPLP